MKQLFTERQGQGKPRIAEVLDDNTRDGLLALLNGCLDEEWFGLSFPRACSYGYAYAGTDLNKMRDTMKGYSVLWPPDLKEAGPPYYSNERVVPTDSQVFDLLEFAYQFIAKPEVGWCHDDQSHHHYGFDQESGRADFTERVNRMFERNGMAFELEDGEVQRIAPVILHDALAAAVFRTGDALLDELLEAARTKFLDHDLTVRKDGLKELWDAWERLKTIEPGKDKKAQAIAILDKATAEPKLRAVLEEEAFKLTAIGNDFMIRHAETTKVPITDSAHVDYLFHRMFAMIRLLLQKSGRL